MILFVNYLGKMRGYPQFSFWISITLVKIYIPCVIINRGKNTIELVGTVLNSSSVGFSYSYAIKLIGGKSIELVIRVAKYA